MRPRSAAPATPRPTSTSRRCCSSWPPSGERSSSSPRSHKASRSPSTSSSRSPKKNVSTRPSSSTKTRLSVDRSRSRRSRRSCRSPSPRRRPAPRHRRIRRRRARAKVTSPLRPSLRHRSSPSSHRVGRASTSWPTRRATRLPPSCSKLLWGRVRPRPSTRRRRKEPCVSSQPSCCR